MGQLFLFIFLMNVSFAWSQTSPFRPETEWAWKPLFNHGQMTVGESLTADQKNQQRRLIQSQLLEFLKNSEQSPSGERITQKENDELLRLLVAAQFKAVDQVRLAQKYQERHDAEVATFCGHDPQACEEGRTVLAAFLDVQNRIEEIEAGRLDLRGLAPTQKELFASHQFLCFYYDIFDENFRTQFKEEQKQELRAFIEKESVGKQVLSDEESLVSSIFHQIKSPSDESENTAVTGFRRSDRESEITALTEKWDRRLIVAKCWRRERVLEWKQGFLKRSMPEVLE